MTRVSVKNGGLDAALKKFYDKPGIRRRESKKAGIKNARKRNKANKD